MLYGITYVIRYNLYRMSLRWPVGELVGIRGNDVTGQFWVHLAQCYTTDFPTLPYQW